MPDRDTLFRTLDTLRSDVDRTAFDDSRAIRHRGDRRTRRQAVAGSLAAVVLVAGGVSLYDGIGRGSSTTRLPAGASSPSPHGTPSAFARPGALGQAPLLQVGDLAGIGTTTGWATSPDPVDESARPQRCVSAPTGGVRADSAMFYTDLGAHVVEHVLQLASPDAAKAAMQGPLASFGTCPTGDPAQAAVVDRGASPVIGADTFAPTTAPSTWDEAVHASRSTTPSGASEPHYYELALVRSGNVLVMLEWSSDGNPVATSPAGSSDAASWVWTAQRLRVALTRATG